MDTTRGHSYQLKNVGDGHQTLTFIRKVPNPEAKFDVATMETVEDGTTTEEVIEVLIDRLTFLDNQVESEHNKKAIQSLTDARTALEEHTADRQKREVEGTNKQ